MEIKGTAVKSIPEFIQLNYKSNYGKWIDSLPETSKKIMSEPIFATSWYPLMDAVVVPVQKAGDLFFKSHEEAAWALGRYSSEVALRGVYKIFLRISSPLFVLSRIDNVVSTYYRPIEAKVLDKNSKKAVMQFFNFTEAESLNMYRIAGWIEKTIEMCANTTIKVTLEHANKPDSYSAIVTAEWL